MGKAEAMVGSEKRISLVAKDLVEHFEIVRSFEGKGMIVPMTVDCSRTLQRINQTRLTA